MFETYGEILRGSEHFLQGAEQIMGPLLVQWARAVLQPPGIMKHPILLHTDLFSLITCVYSNTNLIAGVVSKCVFTCVF